MMMMTIHDVARYWDEYPCGIQVTDAELGSREFFEQIKKRFHENYAAYAHSDELLNFKAYQGKPILEIGCGIGLDALEFASHGAQVTAIDLSPKNLELAKQYFKYNNLIANLEVGNAEQLRFPDNTFELVVAIGVLYYTPYTEKAVEEIWRVLKPGSKAICMFYNRYSWYVLLAKISHPNFDHEQEDPPIIKLYSIKELKHLFRNFSISEIIMDRFPTKTIKRSGLLAMLYNYSLVPFFKILPRSIIEPFGFHIIIKSTK